MLLTDFDETWFLHSLSLVPRLSVGGERERAWYLLFAHARNYPLLNTCFSLVTSLRTPPGEKLSGERSRISWAHYPKAVRTNEIARSVIIT